MEVFGCFPLSLWNTEVTHFCMIRLVANPRNSCLCLSNVQQMSIGLELGLTGGACNTSQDCGYLWSWRC